MFHSCSTETFRVTAAGLPIIYDSQESVTARRAFFCFDIIETPLPDVHILCNLAV